MSTTTAITAERVIEILLAHETELRAAGIRRLSLFDSVARGEAGPESDVDVAVDFDPAACIDLFRLVGLERQLNELLGRPVEILPEPVEKQRLQANMDRNRRHAF